MRTDDLCFTMNLKTLKTVEYFSLKIILKNIFEICWSIFAPQAQLEESANDRGKPEVPFNWDVKRFGGLVFGS